MTCCRFIFVSIILANLLSPALLRPDRIQRSSGLCHDGMPPLGNFCSSVVGEKICRGDEISVRIKNLKTGELLYAAADDLALDEKRRRVFTWDASVDGDWTGEEKWSLEPLSGIMHHGFDLRGSCQALSVRIKSLRPGANGYLYVDARNKSNTTDESPIFTMRNAGNVETGNLGLTTVWNMRIATDNRSQKGINSQYVTFENEAKREYLNGGRPSFFSWHGTTTRRNVFINKSSSPKENIWQIDPIL